MLRIGVDLRVLARGARTGVEQYTIGLMEALAGDQKNSYHFFYNARSKVKLGFSWLSLPKRKLYSFGYPNKLLDLTSAILNRPKIDNLVGGVDAYFLPHFLRASMAQAARVMTFHDLSFEYYPEFFSARHHLWHKLMNPKARDREADLLIAVSQSTKEDLVNLYGVDEKKIKVIYSGVERGLSSGQPDQKKIEAVRKKYHLPQKFILFFGTIEPRKNLQGLIESFDILKQDKKFADVHLVMAGAFGWLFKDIVAQAKKSRWSSFIHFPGFINYQDKASLYHLATVFAYPSFFEGFGFPPLEAMAYGVPVVCSNKTSLPEIVGEAALMIDPYLTGELAEAIKIVLTEDEFRKNLIEKGRERVKEFSWEKTGQEFLAAVEKLK